MAATVPLYARPVIIQDNSAPPAGADPAQRIAEPPRGHSTLGKPQTLWPRHTGGRARIGDTTLRARRTAHGVSGQSLANAGFWPSGGMQQAGCWTRTDLPFWCGAPPETNRRPILTMEPPGTAVRTAISPARARPSGPKLSVLFRRSYALTLAPCADRRWRKPSFPVKGSPTQPTFQPH
jgi:hypothetical protein